MFNNWNFRGDSTNMEAATVLTMMYEMYKQFQGKAGDRQIKDPRIGLTHNMGGFPAMNLISVNIVGL